MNLLNRLTALERKTTVTDGAWIAFINEDGSVSLSHQKHGKNGIPTKDILFHSHHLKTTQNDHFMVTEMVT